MGWVTNGVMAVSGVVGCQPGPVCAAPAKAVSALALA